MTAAMAISDERGYNYLAGIHGYPLPISCGVAHGHVLFLPWHRAYLYVFESALRDRASPCADVDNTRLVVKTITDWVDGHVASPAAVDLTLAGDAAS